MPLLWLSLVFLAGVVLGVLVDWPASWWFAAALGSLVFLLLWGWLRQRVTGLPELVLRLPNPDHFPA